MTENNPSTKNDVSAIDVSKMEAESYNLPSHVQSEKQFETFGEKLSRKIKENPFVPLGLLATVGALATGLYSFQIGNRELSQKMMRARVFAQGFTVLALVGGVWVTSLTKNPAKPENKLSKP